MPLIPIARRAGARLRPHIRAVPFLCATVLSCIVALIAPTTAQAQIYVDAGATGAGNGSSWADAYTDVQSALDVATGSDQIWIAEGTYTASAPLDASDPRTATFLITGDQDGLEIYGGFESGDAFADRSPTDHPVVLSGDLNGDDTDSDGDGIADSGRGENAYHVMVLDGGGGGSGANAGIGAIVAANVTTATVLEGVTVTGGNASGFFPNSVGGGLFCDGNGSGNACSPTIRGVTFIGNTSEVGGGAIYNAGRSGGESSPLITSNTFTGNTTFGSGRAGGAMYNDGESGESSPRIISSTFIGNTAGAGGAIYNRGFTGGVSSPQIIGSTFIGNSAVGSQGRGGAIFNSARRSGGESSPLITSSTFTGNTADLEGGALQNDSGSTGTCSPVITNTILWGNAVSEGGNSGDEIFNREATPTLSHTLIQGGLAGISENDGSSTTDGGNNLDADPLFANPSDPDGPDDVPATADDGLRLSAGSPALDAGDNSALPSDLADLDGDGDTAEPIPFDITGADRIRDNNPDTPPTVDLGAYEAPADVVIPVELASLTATATGNQSVVLTWQTASETNNAGFHVEQRAPDKNDSGIAAWREVAFVAGAGTTTEAQTYRYHVEDVDYGRHAFRLRQVDLDGTATLSEAVEIALTLTEAYALAAYPNPVAAGRSATIDLTVREAQAVTVAVFDVLGRQVATLFDGEVAASEAKTLRLPNRSLASGTYFVRVVGERFTATDRITVVR